MGSFWGRQDQPYQVDPNRDFSIYESFRRELVYYEEFNGLYDPAPSPWGVVETALNTDIACEAQQHLGYCRIVIDSDVNVEEGTLYWGDFLSFDISQNMFYETRCRLPTLPNGTTEISFGMTANNNTGAGGLAGITQFAVFHFDGDGVARAITDDTDGATESVTGVTATNTAWHHYGIDFQDLQDVKFYIDGKREAAGTTFDLTALSAAEAILQPLYKADKTATNATGTIDIDYIKIWADRP